MNKDILGLIESVVAGDYRRILEYFLSNVEFGFKFQKYAESFTQLLIIKIDQLIPSYSGYFCLSVKLLSISGLHCHNTSNKDGRLNIIYGDCHVFARTECCAVAIIDKNEKVFLTYLDDNKVIENYQFESLDKFFIAACTQSMADVDLPKIYNINYVRQAELSAGPAPAAGL
jgi:hypothetical protein